MAKKQKDSELEHLRGLVKSMRSENKHLKKELSRASKRGKHLDTYLDEAKDEEIAKEMIEEEKLESVSLKKSKCPKCGSTQIDVIELGNRKVYTCAATGCTYRTSKKNG